ncbi:MlaD family protein [Pseudomonas silvicola]|nr:MlaD family protein [Pseudomonas silvicola]
MNPPPKHPRRFSLVWLLPVAAAIAAVLVLSGHFRGLGPRITVSFQTAEGLEANQTPVLYKSVPVGKVVSISIDKARDRVDVDIQLQADARAFADKGTRFWVVRPRIGLSEISGVKTLLTGSFIGADAGRAGETAERFRGLEHPPAIRFGEMGTRFVLHADSLNSLNIGSPVYYRRVQVGRVIGSGLSSEGKGVDVTVFIAAPNDRFVTQNTRFWNASGVDIKVGVGGRQVNVESMAAVLNGGVAFQAPAYPPDSPVAEANSRFTLFDERGDALSRPLGYARYLVMHFDDSTRGLAVGAPVEFFGIEIGRVVSVQLDYDPRRQWLSSRVGAVIYPNRLGAVHDKLHKDMGRDDESTTALLMGRFIEHGLRAQARVGNLLTDQKYIQLGFVPGAPAVPFDYDARPIEVPTVAGSFSVMEDQIKRIMAMAGRVQGSELSRNLTRSLEQLPLVVNQVNQQVVPQLRDTLLEANQTLHGVVDSVAEGSSQREQLDQTTTQLKQASRSVQALLDLWNRYPELFLRGRSAEDPAAAASLPRN